MIVSSARNTRGAYFTPKPIADALARWSIRKAGAMVADPSAGDGALLLAAVDRLRELGTPPGHESIEGFDIHHRSLAVALSRLHERGARVRLRHGDVFSQTSLFFGKADALLTNPPWVRSLTVDKTVRRQALRRSREHGVELPLRSSLWAPYLIHVSGFVAPKGRFAVVAPAALLYADYAQPVRDFLLQRFSALTLVTIRAQCFEGAQVGTVLLLAGGRGTDRVDVVDVDGLSDLRGWEDLRRARFSAESLIGRKWSHLRTSTRVTRLLARLSDDGRATRFGDLANVSLGVVTGADDFFLLGRQDVSSHRIPVSQRTPAIQSLKGAPGLSISVDDWAAAVRAGRPGWILNCKMSGTGVAVSAMNRYLALGRRSRVHLGYKCSRRRIWYAVPMPAPPDGFLSYMVGEAARLVLNPARVLITNRAHMVRFSAGVSPRALACAFLCSVTQLSAELAGRIYGGGVLKLEPSDARSVLVISPGRKEQAALQERFDDLEGYLRRGEEAEATKFVDEVLLRGQLGLARKVVAQLQETLVLLRAARMSSSVAK